MQSPDTLAEILATLKRIEQLISMQSGRAALGDITPDLPILPHGRRPVFWEDAEVRDHFTSSHRRMSLSKAVELCRATFGEVRTPSRSAVHRYWLNLDAIIRRGA